MKEILFSKLYNYLVQNNPDLVLSLNEEGKLDGYITDKVAATESLVEQLLSENTPVYIIEEQCLDLLTADLRPSRFNYLLAVLEEEFPEAYKKRKESGVLVYEVINLVEICVLVFDVLHFNESNENDRGIKYAVAGAVSEYLK